MATAITLVIAVFLELTRNHLQASVSPVSRVLYRGDETLLHLEHGFIFSEIRVFEYTGMAKICRFITLVIAYWNLPVAF